MISSKLLLCLAACYFLLPAAKAHFELHSPLPRGENYDLFTESPCGGFNEVSKARSIVPYAFAVNFTNVDAISAPYNISIAFGPGTGLTNSSFTFLATGITYPAVKTLANIDLNNITSKPADGSQATLQIYYDGGPEMRLYACSDIKIDASAKSVLLPSISHNSSPSPSPTQKSAAEQSTISKSAVFLGSLILQLCLLF